MLLAKTLHSSTFRLALVCIAIFGLILFAFLLYILQYSDEVRDRAIRPRPQWRSANPRQDLPRPGRGGIEPVDRLSAQTTAWRIKGRFCLRTRSIDPLAGTLPGWPQSLPHEPRGTGEFKLVSDGAASRMFRAKWVTLPGDVHLLAATEITDLRQFQRRMSYAFSFAALFIAIVTAASSVIVTRRTVSRIEGDQRREPRHHGKRPSKTHTRSMALPMNGTNSRPISIPCWTASNF